MQHCSISQSIHLIWDNWMSLNHPPFTINISRGDSTAAFIQENVYFLRIHYISDIETSWISQRFGFCTKPWHCYNHGTFTYQKYLIFFWSFLNKSKLKLKIILQTDMKTLLAFQDRSDQTANQFDLCLTCRYWLSFHSRSCGIQSCPRKWVNGASLCQVGHNPSSHLD